MELFVLDRNFHFVRLIDVYRSIIWTERWLEAGDFQINLPLQNELIDGETAIKTEYFITTSDTDTLMIIEKIEIKEDLADASEFIISGRSLESLLDRRIVWKYKLWQMQNPADIMYDIIRCSCAGQKALCTSKEADSDVLPERAIPFFEIDDSNKDEITSYVATKRIPKITQSFDGDNVYEIITDFAMKYNIGFKIFYREDDEGNPKLIFKFIKGENRSSSQMELQNGGYKNPIVDLSEKFDNCNSSDYSKDKRRYKNVSLIASTVSGSSSENKTYTTKSETAFGEDISGFDRRETYETTTENKIALITEDTKATYLEEGLNLLKAKYEEISEIVSMTVGTKYMNFLSYSSSHSQPANVPDKDSFYAGMEGISYEPVGDPAKNSRVSIWGRLDKTTIFRPTTDIKEIRPVYDGNGSASAGEDKITTIDRLGLKVIKKEQNTYYDKDGKHHKKGDRKTFTYDLAAPNTVAKQGPWNVYFYSERLNKYIWAGGTINKQKLNNYNNLDTLFKKLLKTGDLSSAGAININKIVTAVSDIFSSGIGRFDNVWSNSVWGGGYGYKDEHSFKTDYKLVEEESFESMMEKASRSAMSPFEIHLIVNGGTIDAYVFENPNCGESNYSIDELPYKGMHEIMCYYMPVVIKDMPFGSHKTQFGGQDKVGFDTYDENYDNDYSEFSFSRYLYFEYAPPGKCYNTGNGQIHFDGAESVKTVNDVWRNTDMIKVYHPTNAIGQRWRKAERDDIRRSRFPFPNTNILIHLGTMENITYGPLQEKAASSIGENTIDESFSADIETRGTFKLNDDYYLGDTVNITNDYGENSEISELALVTEITWSYEPSGNHVVPTLSLINEY